nr:TonB-dependent receptor [Acidobacteriota bacterium]
ESPLPGVFDAFRFSDVASQQSHQISTRADVRLTEKHNLAGSFNFNKGDFDVLTESFPGFNDGGIAPFRSFGLSLNLTSIFTPNLINELRFGGNRIEVNFNLPGTGGAPTGAYGEVISAFNGNGVPRRGQSFGGENGGLIDLLNTGITSLNTFGIDSQFRYTGTTNLADSFTWIKGNHNYKFGAETRFIYENGASNFFRKEFLDFDLTQFGFGVVADNEGNLIPTTGIGATINDYATFLYGLVFNQQQTQYYDKDANRVDQDYRGFRVRDLDLFFQDTWKVRPNLSLNYGLRWEYKAVPYEINGQLSNLVGQDPSQAAPAGGFRFQTVGKNSDNPSTPLYNEDYNNFAPRVGFAYSPDFKDGLIAHLTGGPGRMSIRGGYGVFYDRIFGNLYRNSSANPPFSNTYNEFPFAPLQEIARPTTLGPITSVGNGAELAVNLFPNPGNNMFKQGWATPYTQSWNFGFQRQLGETFLVEADYMGSKATSLIRALDAQATSVLRANALLGRNRAINPTNTRANYLNGTLNTAFGQGAAIINIPVGFSTYNAMALRATKRLARTFLGEGQFQAAYTWSHSIDNAPDPLDAGRGSRVVPRDSSGFGGGLGAERGNSDFDTRHRFVANFIYDLPFRSSNSFVNKIVGEWTVSGIVTLQSGTPFSVFSSRDSVGVGLSQRASYAAPGQGLAPTASESERARTQVGPSRSLFRQPNVGEIGNVQRNSFYGDGYTNTDISVIKRFTLREGVRFRVQADLFNLFNNVNLFNPSNALAQNGIGSTTFGQSTAAFPARRMQFAARLEF